eukprot:gene609-1271_t
MDLDNLMPTLNKEFELDGAYDGMKKDILDHLEHNSLMEQTIVDDQQHQNLTETHWQMNEILPFSQPEKDLEERIMEEIGEHKSRLINIIADYKSNLGCLFSSDLQDQATVPELPEINSQATELVISSTNKPFCIRENRTGSIASSDSMYSSFASDQTMR